MKEESACSNKPHFCKRALAKLSAAFGAPPPEYSFSHFVGSFGGGAYQDAAGSAARLTRPQAIAVDRNGNIWVAERCGANTCAGSNLAPILEFDPSGKLLKSFGVGRFLFPHGLTVDKDGNTSLVSAYIPRPRAVAEIETY